MNTERDRQTDRQTDRHTYRETDRDRDRQADRDRQTDTETNTETKTKTVRQADRDRHIENLLVLASTLTMEMGSRDCLEKRQNCSHTTQSCRILTESVSLLENPAVVYRECSPLLRVQSCQMLSFSSDIGQNRTFHHCKFCIQFSSSHQR